MRAGEWRGSPRTALVGGAAGRSCAGGAALLLTALSAGPVLAGHPEAPAETAPEGAAPSWITPSFDSRLRYEWRNLDPFDDAHALTSRSRFGLLTGEVTDLGLSAFAELETTVALIDDYRSNPADSSTRPSVAGNTVIADPENFELNQLWLRTRHQNLTAIAGRQRIIRHNAAHVAHVGWRQNEQTYDAIGVEWESDDAEFYYAWSPRALRIFGADANDALPGAPLQSFKGDFHFIDGTLRRGDASITGYAYLIDVDNNANVGRNNSFGTIYESGGLRAELAWQDGQSALAGGAYDAWFAHVAIGQDLGPATATFGCEYLGENFKTPFALLHAFNGLADVWAQPRAGLTDLGGAYDGLADLYCKYAVSDLPFGLTMEASAHWFLDDSLSTTYGYEADLVLKKRLNDHLTGIVSAARFVADGASSFPDASQLTLELNLSL